MSASPEKLFLTEQRLLRGQFRLTSPLTKIPKVMYSIDARSSEFLYINQVAERVYGRSIREFYQNPNLWLEVIHPEERDRIRYLVSRAMSTSHRFQIQYHILHPNGEVRYLRDHKKLLKDQNGTLLRIDGAITDITPPAYKQRGNKRVMPFRALRIAEENLRNTLRQLQQAQRIAHIGSWEFDVLTQKVTWSDEMLRILGIDPANEPLLTFANHLQYIHPDDLELWLNTVERSLAEGKPYEIDYRINRRDGELRYVNGRGEVILSEYGHVLTLFVTTLDITERKQAELALQKSEAQLRELAQQEDLINHLARQIRNSLELNTILETAVQEIQELLQVDRCYFAWYRSQANQPFWEVVKETKNPRLCSLITGYSPQQMGSMAAQLLKQEIVQVDDVRLLEEPVLQKFLSSLGCCSVLMLPILTDAGEIGAIVCTHDTKVRPWSPDNVELLRAVCDQLAIALNQAELYRKSRESAQQAQAKSLELETALRELQQTQASLIQSEKMSSLGQMVAGIAHEINNPVSFIYGNVTPALNYISDLLELLELYRFTYPNLTPQIAEKIDQMELDFLAQDLPKLLKSMEVGAERIRGIVNSLRIFSRLDESEIKEVNLHENIDSTLIILHNRLKAKAERPAIEVIKEYGDLPAFKCYPGQLNQVLMNLLANAIDAIEDRNQGHSYEELKALPNQIKIQTTLLPSNWVQIRIADSGIGMKPEVIYKIFDPFYTTKPIGKGTGLGLSISYQIVVEKHQGTLRCVSEPGQETEFIIEIPQ